MLTHRESMTAATSAAILAGIGISSASAEHQALEDFEIDRELRMRISNGFTTQIWTYGGQVWKETQDTLSFHEDERVRISVRNDTPDVRVVSAGHDRMLRIRPGETASIDLTVASLEAFSIDVVGLPAFSRPVKVRANDGALAPT